MMNMCYHCAPLLMGNWFSESDLDPYILADFILDSRGKWELIRRNMMNKPRLLLFFCGIESNPISRHPLYTKDVFRTLKKFL